MTTTTPARPEAVLADLVPALRELAGQLRQQAAQADQLVAQAQQGFVIPATPAGWPAQAGASWTPLNIQLPDRPPDTATHLFTNWRREGLALAIMAVTGWSLRLAVTEMLAKYFGCDWRSSALARVFERLESAGLCHSEKQRFESPGSARSCILVRLAARGMTVMDEVGIESVRSEWERLEPRLSPELVAGAVTLAHHARRLGYAAEVGQDTLQAVRLTRGVEHLLAAAIHLGVPLEERRALWCDQVARQGQIAFWAPNPEARALLAPEAQAFSPYVRSTDPWVLTTKGGQQLWAVM